MSQQAESTSAAPAPDHRRRNWAVAKVAGFFFGLALFAAAIGMVWHQREAMSAALASARHPEWWQVALLAGAVAANIVLTALLFSILIARFGRVSLIEMQAIIASATLINFLPLRPGLFGRIAYHKAVHRIRAIDTGRTIVEASAISAILGAWLIGASLLARFAGVPLWIGVTIPGPVLMALLFMRDHRRIAGASIVRYIEVFVWALRYWVAFQVMAHPIDGSTALALASVSMIASMTPFVSNGLGLREWAIGLLTPVMATGAMSLELGVAAELINRGAEIAIVLVLGLAGTMALVPRLHAAGRKSSRRA